MIGTDVYSAMQTGSPFKSYRKTILGKVWVEAWDNFNDKPIQVRLFGKPEEAIIDVWSEKEDQYFKKMNQKFINAGLIIEVNRATLPQPVAVKIYDDDALMEVLNSKFFKLRSLLNSINDARTLIRLLKVAEDKEASEKITDEIKARLSEVQIAEFHLPPTEAASENK